MLNTRFTSFVAMFAFSTFCLGAPLSVSDGNAAITLDPESVFGLASYTLNGEEQLFEQWFWYRLPGDTFEQPVSNLDLESAIAAGNRIDVSFLSSTLGVDLGYELTGGAPGTRRANLRETVTLQNLTDASLVMAFFMEADFDLNGFGGQDVVSGSHAAMFQTAPGTILRVRSSLTPDAFQISPFPDIFLSLTDFSLTSLDNSGSPFGPGDASFAYQWNLTLPADGSVSYTIDKDFIPEPGTLSLMLLALAFFGGKRLFGR